MNLAMSSISISEQNDLGRGAAEKEDRAKMGSVDQVAIRAQSIDRLCLKPLAGHLPESSKTSGDACIDEKPDHFLFDL